MDVNMWWCQLTSAVYVGLPNDAMATHMPNLAVCVGIDGRSM